MTQATKENPAPIAIRQADGSDIPLIIQLARRIWPLAYAGILLPEHIDNMLERIYSPDNLRAEMESSHRFWIAAAGGCDVAFMSGYREGDTIWLKKIYVDPACKGQGIGRALIETLENAFLPAAEIRLLVNPENAPAMAFYRHMGFQEMGRKPVQMGDYHFLDYIFARPVTR